MFETIVALATPPMKSALAVIRLSGDDCFEVVNKCVPIDLLKIEKKTIKVTSIFDKDNKIDDVVMLLYKNPHSFTGEDSVEIISHGSMLITNQIIKLLISKGARMATNGEFSSRAYMHGKLDLIQAESINDLINATTNESKNISLLALDKKTSSKIYPIKKDIADLLALIAVNIDYPEYHDIEVANKDKIIKECSKILINIEELLKNSRKSIIIKDGLNVAIVGRPNVGKSSLLNAFIGEEKAIVTDVAGTTRDVVEGECIINGIVLHFLDTAGIHESTNLVEQIGIEKSKSTLDKADIVIVVVDASEGITSEDKKIIDLVDKDKLIIVNNKSDLYTQREGVNISAKNNDIDNLKNEIINKVGIQENDYKTPALNNTRQIGLLEQVKDNVLKAKEDAVNDIPIDLISYSLLHAHDLILEILGENNQTDLVKEIFSRFCVGK